MKFKKENLKVNLALMMEIRMIDLMVLNIIILYAHSNIHSHAHKIKAIRVI
jgi:hypothetical protein